MLHAAGAILFKASINQDTGETFVTQCKGGDWREAFLATVQ